MDNLSPEMGKVKVGVWLVQVNDEQKGTLILYHCVKSTEEMYRS